jgi:hypothetical protein
MISCCGGRYAGCDFVNLATNLFLKPVLGGRLEWLLLDRHVDNDT